MEMAFFEGETVLCYYGSLIYEAKCLEKAATEAKDYKYRVHYIGWKDRWDEWVSEDKLLKYNETNIAKQKELKKLHSSLLKKTSRKKKKNKAKSMKDTVSKVHTCDSEDSSVDVPKKKTRFEPLQNELKVIIPDKLKSWLIDDKDLIKRNRQLVHLPAKVTVCQILENYSKSTTSRKKSAATIEFMQGMKDYFNVMLGSQLLYKFERVQYGDILQKYPEKPLCEIYGFIHLLRLFAKMETILTDSSLEKGQIQQLLQDVHKFFNYLVNSSDQLFSLDEYENATAEYHRRIC